MITKKVRCLQLKWLKSRKSNDWRQRLRERNVKRTGEKRTKKCRKLISKALRGKPKSESWKRKASERRKGKSVLIISPTARWVKSRLGSGACLEHKILTGRHPRSGWPIYYAIDVAIPFLKIAIEVDGRSHRNWKHKKCDRRRDLFLRSLGWTVIRIPEHDKVR